MEFLDQLNLVSVIRAHEVQKAGFKEHRFLKQREHAHLITVFSAPNYCDMYNNKAAFMLMLEDKYEFKQTVHVGHPYYLPNFMDGLTYSLPFVMENLSRLAEELMMICLPKADEHVPEDQEEEVERLRQKILALSRLRHVMSGLGEDRRQSIQIPLPDQLQKQSQQKPGVSAAQLAKFEAALQMDFMKEYLKPGAKLGASSTKGGGAVYRGRSKSLNFLELTKPIGKNPPQANAKPAQSGPPRPNFLANKQAAGSKSPESETTDEASVSPTNRRGSGRRERAKAVKFTKPPDLQAVGSANETAEMSKKEKRRSKDDWSLK